MVTPRPEVSGHTIYNRPKDLPDHYVVRGWKAMPDGTVQHKLVAMVAPPTEVGLALLRDGLTYMGLTNIGRQPEDDPVILESWI